MTRLKHRRHGTTIIELAGLMGLLIILAAATVRSLGSLAQVSADNQTSRVTRNEVDRFARNLRADAAKSDSVANTDDAIVFSRGSQQSRYRWDSASCTMFRDSQTNGETNAGDRFRFRIGTGIQSRVLDGPADSQRLIIEVRQSESQTGRPQFLIEVGV